MPRILPALLFSILLTASLPALLTDARGTPLLAWQFLLDPAAGIRSGAFLSPYGKLYRVVTGASAEASGRSVKAIYKDKDGNIQISYDDDAVSDGNVVMRLQGGDPGKATRTQSAMMMAAVFALWLVLAWFVLGKVMPARNGAKYSLHKAIDLRHQREGQQIEYSGGYGDSAEAIAFQTNNPYTLLGVRDKDSTEVILEVYKRKMAALQPENMASASEAARIEAQQEARQLAQAWEAIKKHRRIGVGAGNNPYEKFAEQSKAQTAAQRSEEERAEAERKRQARERAAAEMAARRAAEEAAAEARRQREIEEKRQAEARRKAAEEERLAKAEAERREAEAARVREAKQAAIDVALQDMARLGVGAVINAEIQGEMQRCKLAAVLNATNKLILVGRDGRKLAEPPREQMAEWIVDGKATIIEYGDQFENTLTQLIQTQRKE